MMTDTLVLFPRHLALSDKESRLGTASDRDLLAAYEVERSQPAFTELVRRYGPGEKVGRKGVLTPFPPDTFSPFSLRAVSRRAPDPWNYP
jgi:hypothetical protein